MQLWAHVTCHLIPDLNESKVSKYEAASADIWLERWCSAGAGSVLLVAASHYHYERGHFVIFHISSIWADGRASCDQAPPPQTTTMKAGFSWTTDIMQWAHQASTTTIDYHGCIISWQSRSMQKLQFFNLNIPRPRWAKIEQDWLKSEVDSWTRLDKLPIQLFGKQFPEYAPMPDMDHPSQTDVDIIVPLVSSRCLTLGEWWRQQQQPPSCRIMNSKVISRFYCHCVHWQLCRDSMEDDLSIVFANFDFDVHQNSQYLERVSQ